MAGRNRHQPVHVRDTAVQMRDYDGGSVRVDVAGKRRGGHGHRLKIDVHENRSRADCKNGSRRVHSSVGNGDNVAPRSTIQSAKGKFERIRSVRHSHAVTDTAIGRKLILECRNVWPKYIMAARDYLCKRGTDLFMHRIDLTS